MPSKNRANSRDQKKKRKNNKLYINVFKNIAFERFKKKIALSGGEIK